MSRYQFGSLPTWWHRDHSFFSELKASDTGVGIAAMKCLISLSVLVDYHSKTVQSSLSDLEAVSGLSRPMIVRGLEKLSELKIIEIDKTKYINSYTLVVNLSDVGWAKVPVNKVRKDLKSISNRGIAPFVALKIYITLLSLRYKNNTSVMVSHESLRDYTKVQPNQIRRGLDVLFSSSMIRLNLVEEREANEYEIIGI